MLFGNIILPEEGFMIGTQIMTTEGCVPIESLKKGDHICTYDAEYEQVLIDEILDIEKVESSTIVCIEISSTETKIFCSPDQRFYCTNSETESNWVKASDLKVFNLILSVANKETHEITNIDTKHFKKPFSIFYKLSLKYNKNFLISEHGYLTHNWAFILPIFEWVIGEGPELFPKAIETITSTFILNEVLSGQKKQSQKMFKLKNKHYNPNTGFGAEYDFETGETYVTIIDSEGVEHQVSVDKIGVPDSGRCILLPEPKEIVKTKYSEERKEAIEIEDKVLNFDNQNEKQLEKSKRKFEKNIKDHLEKKERYKNNPDDNDNKDKLKGASDVIRKEIIKGRLEALDKQIVKNQKNLAEVLKRLDSFKK